MTTENEWDDVSARWTVEQAIEALNERLFLHQTTLAGEGAHEAAQLARDLRRPFLAQLRAADAETVPWLLLGEARGCERIPWTLGVCQGAYGNLAPGLRALRDAAGLIADDLRAAAAHIEVWDD